MKKPFKFHELSDVVCSVDGCRTHIKKNVLERKPNADLCYRHYIYKRNKQRNNEKVNY